MTAGKDVRRPRILALIPEHLLDRMMTPANRALLESLGEVNLVPDFGSLGEEEYDALFNGVDAVVTAWGVRRFPPDLAERAPGLRVIAHAAGSVRFMPRALLERGIVITTAKGAIAPTVGEMCLFLAIAGLRGIRGYDRDPGGRAFWPPPGRSAASLFDKQVGLVGFGDTAREFRALLVPFRCRVRVYDPFVTVEDARDCQVESCDFDSILRECEVVSLHVPGMPETRNMLGRRELGLMRDGSVLVNTSRGTVIDMDALVEEAARGRIRVCLDVSVPEPLPEGHPLYALPNVVILPHIAGPTVDHLPHLLGNALRNLAAFLEGRKPPNPVSLEVYDRLSF